MRRVWRFWTAFVALGSLMLLVASPAHAKTYTVTVTGTSDGLTEQSIGATEGCTRFNINELLDAGLSNYRLWAGMSRLEPADDDGRYGMPTIDEIKGNPNVINWSAWDAQFHRPAYAFSPNCVPVVQTSLAEMLALLHANGIRAVVTLRNVDDQGQPAWAARLNPPRTPEDWNEWWEHVFATVYWVNVRNTLEVHDWQVLNEPDSGRGQGWGGTLQDYLVFTQVTNDAIQYVYTTYLPGKTFRLYAPVAKSMNTWVEESLRQNATMIDVIDWHNYSTSHYDNAVQAHAWSARYTPNGIPQTLYISEWGSYRSAYGFANALTYAQLLIDHSRDTAGHVDGSAIFPWYDWQTLKGVIGADGTKTPTFYALRLMIRGLQGGKTRYPVVHNIPSQVDIQAIAAVQEPTVPDPSRTLYVEVLNKTRQGQTMVVDLSAHRPSGSTATLRQFADGRYDVEQGTVAITAGRVTFDLPGLSIMQVKVPLASP
jgi:hypothetical protein